MASTSVSSIRRSYKYDVFLSFRGEDTRKSFVDHLYHALEQKSIDTYRDNEKIKKGEIIGEHLLQSIEESRFYIIVFSKNYASSSWCLDELVKIIECQKTGEHTAYPIFYDVEPNEIRKQSGVVGKAFAKHIEDKCAGKWQEALREAADLAGWELKNTFNGHEAMLIQEIVKEISQELRYIDLSVDAKLIGMEERVRDVVSSLEINADDVRMIGIKGIGGGGKTTLAKAVFNQIYDLFEGSSFVENVRDSTRDRGLKSLQEKVLSDVLNDPHIIGGGAPDLKIVMKKKLRSRKVLVVLDDVDHIDQLEALAGETNWFKPGSRVIITTRDKQVLAAHSVRENLILDVNLLSHEEANCLFNRYAFGSDSPSHGFEMISKKFVSYAQGLPMRIKVLGTFLCGKDELVWTDALERLKEIPLDETLKKLELSYDSLEKDYKEIFLGVACILIGWEKEKAIRVLECFGFHARTGLNVLEQRSLITVSNEGCLSMHNHIEEMGDNIVRRLHPNEPYKHSRLWITKEIEDILVEEKGTEEIRCIIVGEIDPLILMKGLRKMKKLRFLKVVHSNTFYMHGGIREDSLHLPDGLQYLIWDSYPFMCLPKSFRASNLVGLEMDYSEIRHFGTKGERHDLKKLRFIDLNHCKLRTLDIGLFPNLERLNLVSCRELVKLHMPVKSCRLNFIRIVHCELIILLDLSWTQDLELLHIERCESVKEMHMPVQSFRIKIFKLEICWLKTLDLSLAENFAKLDIAECRNLVELHMPSKSFRITFLRLKDCGLKTLNLSRAQSINTLDIRECRNLIELHMPVENVNIESLYLSHSKLKTLDLKSVRNLKHLDVSFSHCLEELHMPVENVKLESLVLMHTNLKTLDLVGAQNLVSLMVIECKNLVDLYMPVENVKLESLVLRDTSMTTLNLMGARNLVYLIIRNFKSVVKLHMPVEITKLESVTLIHSNVRTLDLAGAQNLVNVDVDHCMELVKLHMHVELIKLESIRLSHSNVRTVYLASAQNLVSVVINHCMELVELHMPVEIINLESFELCHSNVRTLDLTRAQNLVSLNVQNCKLLVELQMPVENAKLKSLDLRHFKVRTLDVASAQNLHSLTLHKCEYHVESNMTFGMPTLDKLSLRSNKLKTLDLKSSTNLRSLYLKCYTLAEIHAPIGCLRDRVFIRTYGNRCHSLNPFLVNQGSLMFLTDLCLSVSSSDITACKSHPDNTLRDLEFDCTYEEPQSSLTRNLEKKNFVCLRTCINFASLLRSSGDLQFLRKLTFKGNIPEVPIELDQLECLQELNFVSTPIDHLQDSLCMLKHLKSLKLEYCQLLKQLPEDLGRLKCLEELHVTYCESLQDIPNSIWELECLKVLNLEGCIQVKNLPKEIGRLKCLKELNVEVTGIIQFPQSIFQLKGLRTVASKGMLKSYGITSDEELSELRDIAYI